MKTIYKYPIQVLDAQPVRIPAGAQILCVQTQQEQPCLWAMVNTDNAPEARHILTRGTGQRLTEQEGRYIGTYQLRGGALVFHVFEATQ